MFRACRGFLNPKDGGKTLIPRGVLSALVPRTWDCTSGGTFIFLKVSILGHEIVHRVAPSFSSKSVSGWGTVQYSTVLYRLQSSASEEPHKKNGAPLP